MTKLALTIAGILATISGIKATEIQDQAQHNCSTQPKNLIEIKEEAKSNLLVIQENLKLIGALSMNKSTFECSEADLFEIANVKNLITAYESDQNNRNFLILLLNRIGQHIKEILDIQNEAEGENLYEKIKQCKDLYNKKFAEFFASRKPIKMATAKQSKESKSLLWEENNTIYIYNLQNVHCELCKKEATVKEISLSIALLNLSKFQPTEKDENHNKILTEVIEQTKKIQKLNTAFIASRSIEESALTLLISKLQIEVTQELVKKVKESFPEIMPFIGVIIKTEQ